MKGLMLIAGGFEDTEAITTRDILLRAGIDIDCASISDQLEAVSSLGIVLKCNLLFKDIVYSDYDFIVIPGGKKGVETIDHCEQAIDLILRFYDDKKQIYAICAAPRILGRLGLLDHLDFTCYPGFESHIDGHYTGATVTCSSPYIITAKSMACSIDFALAIVERLLGKEVKNLVIEGIQPTGNYI